MQGVVGEASCVLGSDKGREGRYYGGPLGADVAQRILPENPFFKKLESIREIVTLYSNTVATLL